MLIVRQNLMMVKVSHHLTVDNVLKDFATDRCQRDRSVVGRVTTVAFLEYRGCIGIFPVTRYLTLFQGSVEKRVKAGAISSAYSFRRRVGT